MRTQTKQILASVFTLAFLLPSAAVAMPIEDGQVLYLGGTIPNLKEGAVGALDTTQDSSLVYEYPSGKLVIPYAKIQSFEYSQKLARHWGVLPTVAIGLLKHLQRRHYFRISYRDEANVAQAVVFEVPKQMPQTLLAVLQTRAPSAYRSPTAYRRLPYPPRPQYPPYPGRPL